MKIKTLVVKEFEISEEDLDVRIGDHYEKGDKYSFFQDPKTGKYYRPVDGFTVIGEDLRDRFIEVIPISAPDDPDPSQTTG